MSERIALCCSCSFTRYTLLPELSTFPLWFYGIYFLLKVFTWGEVRSHRACSPLFPGLECRQSPGALLSTARMSEGELVQKPVEGFPALPGPSTPEAWMWLMRFFRSKERMGWGVGKQGFNLSTELNMASYADKWIDTVIILVITVNFEKV